MIHSSTDQATGKPLWRHQMKKKIHVTGPLWGESTGHLTKAIDGGALVFSLICTWRTNGWANNRYAITLIMTSLWCSTKVTHHNTNALPMQHLFITTTACFTQSIKPVGHHIHVHTSTLRHNASAVYLMEYGHYPTAHWKLHRIHCRWTFPNCFGRYSVI